MIAVFFSLSVIAQDRITRKVNRYVGWMLDDKKPDVWVAAARLEKLGRQALPILRRKVGVLPEMARVACAKVFISLNSSDYGLELLLKVVETGADPQAKLTAITLIGIHGDFELEERLNKILENTFNPYIKIALAKTLWQVARNPRATSILKSYLRSENTEIQYASALAMGEIHNVQDAKPVLVKLKNEPSLRGRLARSLLEKEKLSTRYEMALRRKTKKAVLEYPLFDEILQKIRQFHVDGDKFTKKNLVHAAIKGMVKKTDIHSSFWNKEEWEDFNSKAIKEEYVGIGIWVEKRKGYFVVMEPFYSGPAYRAGIRSKDRILEINGYVTAGKSVNDLKKKIRESKTPSLVLKIYREGWLKARIIKIKREKIQFPSLYSRMLPGKIGYIRLLQFSTKAAKHVEDALLKLEKQKVKGVIFDLRGNPGGWLYASVLILDKFLNGGKLLVYSEGRHPIVGRRQSYYSTSKGTRSFPLVILVDGGSASASEIVAGAMKHYKRALIIGQNTYGKGSVQEIMPLKNLPKGRLKLTIAKYFLPDGTCIHNIMNEDGTIKIHKGIRPDVEVKLKTYEAWKNEAYAKILEKHSFQKYMQHYYAKHKKLFQQLAENDKLSTKLYPGFSKWYKSLHTRASEQDVRRWLRAQIRHFVADERGKAFVCDYIEDHCLQRGILEICKKMKISANKVQEFQSFAK